MNLENVGFIICQAGLPAVARYLRAKAGEEGRNRTDDSIPQGGYAYFPLFTASLNVVDIGAH